MFLASDVTERLAAEARTLATHLAAVVDELTLLGDWSGPDAASFRGRWATEVTEPLRTAAAALDGVTLEELGPMLGALLHV